MNKAKILHEVNLQEDVDNIEDHEKMCIFRPVFCFHYQCQQKKIKYSLSSIKNHFKCIHQGVDFEEQHLENSDEFTVGFGLKALYHKGIIHKWIQDVVFGLKKFFKKIQGLPQQIVKSNLA